MPTDSELKQAYESCTGFVRGHFPDHPSEVLQELSEEALPAEARDYYGEGSIIEDFEKQIAQLLGKPSTVFMPSGTMAQQIALRIVCDRQNLKRFGIHSTSHLEIHEQNAYRVLHGLESVILGEPNHFLALPSIENAGPLSAVVLELPQRENGGILPSWQELCDISNYCREYKIHLHMDGARLWECKSFYKREYSEICALFDSVYVSFYKGLGAIAGAALCGTPEFIAEAKIWQRLHGGNLISLFPYVLSARRGLALRLNKMDSYFQEAKKIAADLRTVPGIQVLPNPLQTPMMHLHIHRSKESLEQASFEIARDLKISISKKFAVSEIEGHSKLELSVGDATLELGHEKILEIFKALMGKSF